MEGTSNYSLPEGKVLALKILYSNRQSAHNKFQYPEVGEIVTDPNWDSNPECGNGLHGYLWGHGDISVSLYMPGGDHLYQIHEVGEHVCLRDKIKYPSALVVAEFSSIVDALEFLEKYTPESYADGNNPRKVLDIMEEKEYSWMKGSPVQTTDNHTIQKGGMCAIQRSTEDLALQKAGASSIQITRNSSYQSAGYSSLQVGGDRVTQKSFQDSIQNAGYNATQIGGGECIQNALSNATQTAGEFSIQNSSTDSRLSAGEYSIQRAGYRSMCKAGLNSHIFIAYPTSGPLSYAHAFVDGKIIKADTWYKVEDKTGKFYEVDPAGKRVTPTWKTRLWSRLANLINLRW